MGSTFSSIRPHFATRFTRRFGQIHPFASAGLAFAGMTPELAIAVSNAGGIGALGLGFMPPEELRTKIHAIRAATDAPFNINFITCFENDAQIRVCAEEEVPIASFHWGHPASAHLKILADAGVSVWEQVGTVEDGLSAVNDGIEVVIAQGWEAGGHNYGGLGTVAFVPAMLGADGIWVGTRLVASREANVHPFHHEALIRAKGTDTVRSSIFGPEMPHFNPMRLLRNRVVNEYTDRLEADPMERNHLP